MDLYASARDARDNITYPLTPENTTVRIDGQEADIERIAVQPNGEFLVKFKGPQESGSHSIVATVVTEQGTVTGQKGFEVSGEAIETSLQVDERQGTVDAATAMWKYPTRYNAAVFRRGMDNPHFVFTSSGASQDMVACAEIIAPGNRCLWRGRLAPGLSYDGFTEWSGSWDWSGPDGRRLIKEEIPVGVYKVKAYLSDANRPGTRYAEKQNEFFVIFDYEQNDQSFITRDQEYSYDVSMFRPLEVSLNLYDSRVWKTALNWISGAVTREEAVVGDSERDIAHLARNIDGQMVFHHSASDETNVFGALDLQPSGGDGYDNDFDGDVDEPDENWKHNYEYKSPGGKAFYRREILSFPLPTMFFPKYVDDVGNEYNNFLNASQIAWYNPILEMLDKDFDPENRISRQHSLGCCQDYAMLTCAYLKSIGIKSRFVVGVERGNLFTPGGHAWVRWTDEHGEEKHLETDYGTNKSMWEENKADEDWYNGRFTRIYARKGDDPNVLEDLSQLYAQQESRQEMALEAVDRGSVAEAVYEPLLRYEITAIPVFRPGETSSVGIKIYNSYNEAKTVTVCVCLEPAGPFPPGVGEILPAASAAEQIEIPAGASQDKEVPLTVDGFATPGQYRLNVYEAVGEETVGLGASASAEVASKLAVRPELPEQVIQNQSFMFRVALTNNGPETINDVFVTLGNPYDFQSPDSLRQEVASINAGESYTFSWELTPLTFGELLLPVEVFSSNGGSCQLREAVRSLGAPTIYISAVAPEKVESGQSFSLPVDVFNGGNIALEQVRLEVTAPPGVTVDGDGEELEAIGAQERRTVNLNVSQNAQDDFALKLSALAANAPAAQAYVPINLARPDMFADILFGEETPGVDQHSETIEVIEGEPFTIKAYLRNTGESILHNIQLESSGGHVQNISELLPGESREIALEFVPVNPGLGEISITFKADEVQKSWTRTLLVQKFALSVALPKLKYELGEPVPLNIQITNEVPGMRFIDLKLRIELSGHDVTKSAEIPIFSLAPQETKEISYTLDTSGISNGIYAIATTLLAHEQKVVADSKELQIGELAAPDTTAPAVASTDPADDAAGVVVTKTISVTFNEEVQAGTAYDGIAVKDANGAAVAVTKSIAGKVLSIKPNASLAYGTTYTVTVPAGAVEDLAGNGLVEDDSFSFTTQSAPSSGGGGGGAPAAPATPATPPGAVEPVSDAALEEALEGAAQTGTVAISALAGQEKVALTLSQLSRVEGAKKPLAVTVGGVQFTLPPAAVATLAGVEGAQVEITAEPLATAEAQQLAAQATNAALFRVAGNIYELNIAAVQTDGDRLAITDLGGAIRVVLPVPAEAREAAAAGKLTAGWYNEATNTWEELVSTYDAATQTMVFEVTHLSKYALLERVAAAPPQPQPRKTFADITGHWAQKDIEVMARLGIARGVGDNKFNPEGQVTRAEFAAFLIRSLGIEEVKSATGNFKDVAATAWHYGAIEAAYASGLVSGYGDGTFRPDKNISREEIAAMVTRALAQAGQEVPVADADALLAQFTDAKQISAWAKEAAAQAVSAGIVGGRGGNRFAPGENASRAEAVVMLKRMLVKLGAIE